MQKTKRKIVTILIALLLTTSTSASMMLLPTASAHDPAWQIPTTAYINVAPNPVGVGQQVIIVFWLDRTPSGSLVTNNVKMHNYKLDITKPDGTTEQRTVTEVTDPTSSAYILWTPDQVGDYKFVFTYPGQTYVWNSTNTPGLSAASSAYYGDIFKPSTSKTFTLTVQQEQLPAAITSYPLPTEYWTRPIEGQNTDWWTIASNWLGTGSPPISGWSGRLNPDGIAPNSAHIMWTKPFREGGVVGGSYVGREGNTYYNGMSYNQGFSNPIIMYGRLYYPLSYGNSGSGGKYLCVDLRTGEEIWSINTTATGTSLVPSFGYLYNYDDGNQHGVLPEGLLFTSNFARAYEPSTGLLTNWNLTNVPSGTAVRGPNGEHYRYTLTNIGTSAAPNWRLTEWNSSKLNDLTPGQIGVGNWFLNGFFNGSDSRMFDWNVSVPVLSGKSNPTITWAVRDDILIGKSSTFVGTSDASSFGTPDPYTFWALSLKPGNQGRLLWIKNYTAPEGNRTLIVGPVDEVNRVFYMYVKETMSWMAFSFDSGNLLWGPTSPSQSDYDYYEGWLYANCAYGKLYYCNYGGILYCVDSLSGKLLWTYGNGGPGNSTSSGLQNQWGRYPMSIGAIADGKIYLHPSEHSPDSPLYKNALVRCVNATDGTEIWTIMGWVGVAGASSMAEADGFLVYLNTYSMEIDCIGKGPSQLTVTAPDTAVELGTSVVIRGTVTDIAAGTEQDEQSARFPNGVPAVSDQSMTAWMEYVYMQKPRPTDVTGVTVSINVLDANGNYRNIGQATSDANGKYTFTWTPDIPGDFILTASFTGSESYYPSHDETSFTVTQTAPTPTQQPLQELPPTEMYFTISTAAIVIAIAVVGAVLLLAARKRA